MTENYLLAVLESVTLATQTGNEQQLTDGNSTLLDMNIQDNEFNSWTTTLNNYQDAVTQAAANVAKDPTSQKYQAALTAAQTAFQNAETNQQTVTQQCDSATQTEDNQTSQDSQNLQQIVTLLNAINQVQSSLTSMLSQVY